MKLSRFALLCLFLCLSACRVRATELCLIDSAMRKADPRLETPVTLTETRISLGALLERLSAKTGVSLRMDTTSPASGAMLLVFLHRQPLADTMNSLYAFFGYRNARWEWHRSGTAGTYDYFFAQTPASRDLAATRKQQAQDAFDAHAKVMLEIARMMPEERKRNAVRIDESLFNSTNYIGKSWVQDEETWQGLRAFLDSVKPEEQRKIFAGGTIKIPMEALTDEGRAFATEEASHGKTIVNGEAIPNKPDGIRFYTQWDSENTAPIFFAGSVSKMGGLGLEKGLNLRQAAQWLLEGDAKTHPAEAQSIKAPEMPYPSDPAGGDTLQTMQSKPFQQLNWVTFRLIQMAHEMPQNLIAHLPDKQTFDPREPYNKTPEKFLEAVSKGEFAIMRKWRGETLLIEFPAWYRQIDQNIPYAVWKPFAQALVANRGRDTLPLPLVAKTSAALSDVQWTHLVTDAPFLEQARTLAGLFGLAQRYPDLLREKGATITADLAADLSHTKPNSYSKPFKVSEAAQALRLHQAPSKATPNQIMVSFEVQDKKDEWHYVTGYSMPRGVKN